MTNKRAIELLNTGTQMPSVPHTAEEVNEACMLACDILRQYEQSIKELTAHTLDIGIAEHYKNIGLPMARLDELAEADKTGRVVILPEKYFAD